MNKPLIKYSLMFLMAVGLFRDFVFIIPTWQKLCPAPYLSVDAPYYHREAKAIIKKKDFLNLRDRYHSQGFPIFLAGVFSLFEHRIESTKILFLVFVLLITLLIVYAGEKYFQPGVGYLAGVFSALSIAFMVYAATIQYEVLVTLLILSSSLLIIEGFLKGKKRCFFAAGFILSMICMIHVRFIVLLILVLLYIGAFLKFKKNKVLSLVLLALGSLSLILPWSVYHSIKEKKVAVIQEANYSHRVLRKCFNYNSKGDSSPYVRATKVNGLKFIAKHPIKSIVLTKERFLQFWNLSPNIWSLGFSSPIAKSLGNKQEVGPFKTRDLETIFVIFYLIVFAGGLVLFFMKKGATLIPRRILAIFCVVILAVSIVPLLISGSPRYCIPILPYVYLFQSYFICELVKKFNKCNSPSPRCS